MTSRASELCVVVACLALGAQSGCVTESRSGRHTSIDADQQTSASQSVPAQGGQDVDAIELYVLPVVLDWDKVPGPDGIQARAMLFRFSEAPPVRLSRGTLDFLLYRGRLKAEDLATATVFHTWSFTPAEIAPSLERNIVGDGYTLRLAWGAHVPDGEFVTLVARYVPSKGAPVRSAPVTLLMKPDGK